MHKIVFSKRAEEDLEEIWFYTYTRWSLVQADKYIDELFDACMRLSNNINLGVSAEHIRSGYRKYQVNRHLIFYTVSEQSKSVSIVRILHEKMDIEGHVRE